MSNVSNNYNLADKYCPSFDDTLKATMANENNDAAATQCVFQPTPEAQSHFQFPGARTSPAPSRVSGD